MNKDQIPEQNRLIETTFDPEEGYFRDAQDNVVDKETGEILDPEGIAVIGQMEEPDPELIKLRALYPGYTDADLKRYFLKRNHQKTNK